MSARKQTIIFLSGIVFVFMIVINLFQVGGREFISTYNNALLLVFLVTASVLAGSYWHTIRNRVEAGRVWLPLSLGIGFYALGQLTWIVYSLGGIEVPYPSLGDLFWVVAYPLLAVSLINKNLLLGILPNKRQIAFVVGIGAVFLAGISVFILAPMLEYAGTARFVETVLNFFYPLMDFVILVAAGFLVIILWKGRLSLTWKFIAAGLPALTVSDVFFIYTTWNGLYYAEGADVNANILSHAIDIGDGLAAFLLVVGISSFEGTVSIRQENMSFEIDRIISSLPPADKPLILGRDMQDVFDKIFLMVDQDHRVYYFSQYYRDVCKATGGNHGSNIGEPLNTILGVDEYFLKKFYMGLESQQRKSFEADLRFGSYLVPALIEVRPARNGSDVFFRYRRDNPPAGVEERSPVEIVMIEDALRSVKGIQNVSIETQETLAFFVIEIQEMYLFLVQMGGFQVGNFLAEKFNHLAALEHANVRIADGRVVLTGIVNPGSMSKLIGLTLKTVQGFTSIESTREVVRLLNDKIPQSIIRSAQNAGLAL